MKLADTLSIGISALAFVLSLAAAVISLISQKSERQRSVKREISEILNKILTLQLEQGKIAREFRNTDPAYFGWSTGQISQQLTLLLQQASILAPESHSITSVEMNTLAVTAENIGDVFIAEDFFEKSVSLASAGYFTALASRSFAVFLFRHRRFDDGRERFKASLAALRGSDAQTRMTNGSTYQMWALHERDIAHSPSRATELFESAQEEYRGLDSEEARAAALTQLQAAMAMTVPSHAGAPKVEDAAC